MIRRPPRILVSNDDGINAHGHQDAGADRPRAQRRRLGGGARDQPERCRALADADPAVAGAPPRRAPLLGRRHADRLRADRAAADRRGRAGRPRALGHQPRRQSRRGRHLFRHGGGRHGGHPVQGARDRLQPGLREPPAHQVADGRALRARGDRAPAVAAVDAGRADQRQLPRPRSGRGAGRPGHHPGQAQDRRHAARAHRPARRALSVDRRPARGHATRARAPISRPSPRATSRSRRSIST